MNVNDVFYLFIFFDDIIIHSFLRLFPAVLRLSSLHDEIHTHSEIPYMVLCCNSPYAHQPISLDY